MEWSGSAASSYAVDGKTLDRSWPVLLVLVSVYSTKKLLVGVVSISSELYAYATYHTVLLSQFEI